MQSKQLHSVQWKRLLAPRNWSCYCVGLLCAACGVHEYRYNVPLHDAASDFAPTGSVEVRPQDAGLDSGQQGSDAAAPTADASQTMDGRSAADGGMIGDAGVAADGGKPDAGKPDAGKPDAGKPDAGKPDAGKPDAGKPSAPPATSDLVLGGKQLRKQDVLAFIHLGHSNMGGSATKPVELRPYHFTDLHPRAWMYRVGKPPEPALEPTAREDREQRAGPGLALLKQAAERAPDKYFMSLGYGVSGAHCNNFLPGGAFLDSVIRSPLAIKDRVTFVGIVVMFGATEKETPETLASFSDCVNGVITAIREALGQPDLPALISDYEMGGTGSYDPKGDFGTKMIPVIAKLPSVVSNSALVPTEGVEMEDDHHFDLQGQIVWTQRLLDIMKAKGWAPWLVK